MPVGTFHRTWLEKIVAENDPRFVKPRVDKALKAVQAVCYYGVEKLKDLNRTEIFRNTFMGETIGYCARRRDLTYHSDNCGTLIEGLKFKIRGMAVPVTLAEDMTPYTADMLHRKFGFCYIGNDGIRHGLRSGHGEGIHLCTDAPDRKGERAQAVIEKLQT